MEFSVVCIDGFMSFMDVEDDLLRYGGWFEVLWS